MSRKDIYTPPFPHITMPNPSIYGIMGEENICAMIADFYRRLHDSPIKHIFHSDIHTGTQRSAWFFIEILGGPQLFQQNRGEPRMRARHIPFQITDEQRDVWVACFLETLRHASQRYAFPEEHLEGFRNYLIEFSKWMVSVKPE